MHKIISSKTVDERYLNIEITIKQARYLTVTIKQCFDNGSQFYFSIVSRKYQRSYNMSELHDKPKKEKKKKKQSYFYNFTDRKFQLYLKNLKIYYIIFHAIM